MRGNKIGAIFIIAAMALAGVGTSFAMWTQTLNSSETVHVATFGIAWSTGTVTTSGDSQGLVTGTETIDGNGNLVVTINNAYPCVDVYIPYDIHLTGQVNVILNQISFTYTNFDPAWMIYYTSTDGVLLTATYIYYGYIEVHLGENAVQGATYTFTNTVTGHGYNEGNPPSQGKTVTLPPGVVTAVFQNPGPVSYWKTTLSNVPAGNYNVHNGDWVGWCVSETTFIVPGLPYTIQLMSSYDPMNPWPGNHGPHDWPCVNWIINHKGNYPTATINDIQGAIWYFLDGGQMPGGIGNTIVNDALANGQNFVPSTGQVVAGTVHRKPRFPERVLCSAHLHRSRSIEKRLVHDLTDKST